MILRVSAREAGHALRHRDAMAVLAGLFPERLAQRLVAEQDRVRVSSVDSAVVPADSARSLSGAGSARRNPGPGFRVLVSEQGLRALAASMRRSSVTRPAWDSRMSRDSQGC